MFGFRLSPTVPLCLQRSHPGGEGPVRGPWQSEAEKSSLGSQVSQQGPDLGRGMKEGGWATQKQTKSGARREQAAKRPPHTHSASMGPVQPCISPSHETATGRLLPEYGSLARGPGLQRKLHSLPLVCLRHITTLGRWEHTAKKGSNKLAKDRGSCPKACSNILQCIVK